jgi:periplasmic copper chaperone A
MHSTPRSRFTLRSVAVVAVAALSLAACGGDDAASDPAEPEASTGVEMSIADAWSRQPAAGQSVSAAYGIVSNPGDVDVTIVSASSPISTQVELHETLVDDDGMMSMVEREQGFVVPAGGEFVFEPGGPHVMILGIDAASYPDEVEVTLEFDAAEPLTFTAEVRAIDGDMDMDMDGDMDGDG